MTIACRFSPQAIVHYYHVTLNSNFAIKKITTTTTNKNKTKIKIVNNESEDMVKHIILENPTGNSSFLSTLIEILL